MLCDVSVEMASTHFQVVCLSSEAFNDTLGLVKHATIL